MAENAEYQLKMIGTAVVKYLSEHITNIKSPPHEREVSFVLVYQIGLYYISLSDWDTANIWSLFPERINYWGNYPVGYNDPRMLAKVAYKTEEWLITRGYTLTMKDPE